MVICIKSEIDSRVMIYPLLRSLYNHGSVLLLTTNPAIKRVIEGDYYGSWRNMTIIVSETGDTDDVCSEYGIAEGDYDFVIMDNMGTLEFDCMYVLLGKYHTEEFSNDVKYLIEEDPSKITLVQFGNPPTMEKKKPEKGQERGRVPEGNTVSKVQLQFPKYEDFESVEGTLLFPRVDAKLVKDIYKRIKDVIGLEESIYTREVGRKDESSGHLSRQNELWEI